MSSSISQSSSNQVLQETILWQQLIAQHQKAVSDISKYANNTATDKGKSREGKEKCSNSSILVLPWPHSNIKPTEMFSSFSELNLVFILRWFSFCFYAKL